MRIKVQAFDDQDSVICSHILQVLYTLPCGPNSDDAVISESGAMNIFFLLEKVGPTFAWLGLPCVTCSPGMSSISSHPDHSCCNSFEIQTSAGKWEWFGACYAPVGWNNSSRRGTELPFCCLEVVRIKKPPMLHECPQQLSLDMFVWHICFPYRDSSKNFTCRSHSGQHSTPSQGLGRDRGIGATHSH